jgi:antitoxin component of MazEF toxin-antitoxin module
MPKPVTLGRYVKDGDALAVRLPKELTSALTWRIGDRIAIRCSGEKLVLERLPLETLAIVRDGLPREVNRS